MRDISASSTGISILMRKYKKTQVSENMSRMVAIAPHVDSRCCCCCDIVNAALYVTIRDVVNVTSMRVDGMK